MIELPTPFEAIQPELESRCRRIAARCPARYQRDVADDVLSVMFLNHAQAKRRGKALSASDLGWAGAQHARWRSTAVYSRARDERHQTLSLDHALDDALHPIHERLGAVLTTDTLENPFERVRIRIDWGVFARTQSRRVRRVLLALARGERKGDIARRLRITPGRLSQILVKVQVDLLDFFESDLPL